MSHLYKLGEMADHTVKAFILFLDTKILKKINISYSVVRKLVLFFKIDSLVQ